MARVFSANSLLARVRERTWARLAAPRAAVVGGYLVLIAIFTWPFPVQFWDQVVLARGSDLYPHIWNLWWVRFSLFTLHQNPYYTTYLQYPSGMPLVYHVLDPLNSIVSIPLQMLFGLVPAFNLLRFAHLLFAALAAYALCRVLRLSRLASWVGGALFLLCPILSDSFDLGQLVEISVGWIPLYVLCLVQGLGNNALGVSPGRIAWLAGAALALTASALATWYFFIALVVFTAIYVLWEALGVALFNTRPGNTASDDARAPNGSANASSRGRAIVWLIARSAAVGIASVILLSPIIIALAKENAADPAGVITPQRTVIANSADLLALFMPLPAHISNSTINPHGANPALGWSIIALAVVGAVLRRRDKQGGEYRRGAFLRRLFWAVVALAFALLAFGPHLLIAGNDTGVPMPYLLLSKLPFLGAARVPLRFVLLVSLALAVLAAYGVAAGQERLSSTRLRTAITGALAVAVVAELFGIPRVMFRPTVDPYFSTIAATGADGSNAAVLELPQGERSAPAMLTETVHQRPILGGYTARHYPYPWLGATPGVAQLAAGNPDALGAPDIITPTVQQSALAALDYYGVRYVALYTTGNRGLDGRNRATVTGLLDAQGIKPQYGDKTVTVYRIPPQPKDRPFVGLGDGWYAVEGEGTGKPPWRWTNGQARVQLTNPTGHDAAVTLQLSPYSVESTRTMVVLLDGRELGRSMVNPYPAQPVSFNFNLPSGEHWLDLRSLEPPVTPKGDARSISLGFERLALIRNP